MRFTLPVSTTRQIGETYINSQGLVLGVILSKKDVIIVDADANESTQPTTKIAVFGACAIKCNVNAEITEETPIWYDDTSGEFKMFTSNDLSKKIVGFITPHHKDGNNNIISNYDISLYEFQLLGF